MSFINVCCVVHSKCNIQTLTFVTLHFLQHKVIGVSGATLDIAVQVVGVVIGREHGIVTNHLHYRVEQAVCFQIGVVRAGSPKHTWPSATQKTVQVSAPYLYGLAHA